MLSILDMVQIVRCSDMCKLDSFSAVCTHDNLSHGSTANKFNNSIKTGCNTTKEEFHFLSAQNYIFTTKHTHYNVCSLNYNNMRIESTNRAKC
ncbi:hypothetical protein NP493_216g01046 [Ridgeia piscesae]|uniref:Uncharacterized protein n=1 Tax=Ridgeia piscesae TaxID=27915 RepID=A0AAD9P0Q2_RIDPI|nr:hypothetical protein NP493_216g01046 [Ridgeia piscesae]